MTSAGQQVYKLYRGVWPQNVSRMAKYAVRFIDGAWKITVLYDVGYGERYLAVEGGDADLPNRINHLKTSVAGQGGGAFYVNEYKHILVPVLKDGTSQYYYCEDLQSDLVFEYEGKPLTTRPVRPDGSNLEPGEKWVGPRPGIPYVLAAGGMDVYYETPALTDTDPPTVKPRTTRKVLLSKVLKDPVLVRHTAQIVARIRGHQGGRFYVNEHGAIFTPLDAGDGNGLDYVFCGSLALAAWFPPPVTY